MLRQRSQHPPQVFRKRALAAPDFGSDLGGVATARIGGQLALQPQHAIERRIEAVETARRVVVSGAKSTDEQSAFLVQTPAAATTCGTQKVRTQPIVASPSFLLDQYRLLLIADRDRDAIPDQQSGAVQFEHVEPGVLLDQIFATVCGALVTFFGAQSIKIADEVECHAGVKNKSFVAATRTCVPTSAAASN
ncbi:hypothetical protein [Bradyrhizobium sp. USDA 10063]